MDRFLRKWLGNGRLFLVAMLVGVLIILVPVSYRKFFIESNAFQGVTISPTLNTLTRDILVTQQIDTDVAASLKQQGFDLIVDLRPDGEDRQQTSSKEMAAAAKAAGLKFSYVPVPHGDIPERAVTELKEVLEKPHGKVLLYCRSGRRAARTWGLMEASRSGGMSPDEIVAAVKASGQDAADLRQDLEFRAAHRKTVAGERT